MVTRGKGGHPSNLYLPGRDLREGRSALGASGYREFLYQVECDVKHVTGTQFHVSIFKAEQVIIKIAVTVETMRQSVSSYRNLLGYEAQW